MSREERIAELEELANEDLSKYDAMCIDAHSSAKYTARKALVIIKELEKENKRFKEEIPHYKCGLSNVRWMLENPREPLWKAHLQIESADLIAKNALLKKPITG